MKTEDNRTRWQKLGDSLQPCELLPEDKGYLTSYLPIKKGFKKTVTSGYKDKWLLYMRLEEVGHYKQNAGRRGANTWLRTHYQQLRGIEKYG